MPIYRTPDREIIEEKTKLSGSEYSGDDKTKPLSSSTSAEAEAPPATDRHNAKTVKLSGSGKRDQQDEKTRLIGARRTRTETSVENEQHFDAPNSLDDPVVGWLVVVEGPGSGNSVTLGYGLNTVGRGEESRVRINFGDEQISRDGHAQIIYDHKNVKFYVQHGGGDNLTYLDSAPVLSPQELKGGEQISMGDTTLRFVPLCNDAFNWE